MSVDEGRAGRRIRIEYAGAAHHPMARGNQGRDIYADDRFRKLRLETLAERHVEPELESLKRSLEREYTSSASATT